MGGATRLGSAPLGGALGSKRRRWPEGRRFVRGRGRAGRRGDRGGEDERQTHPWASVGKRRAWARIKTERTGTQLLGARLLHTGAAPTLACLCGRRTSSCCETGLRVRHPWAACHRCPQPSPPQPFPQTVLVAGGSGSENSTEPLGAILPSPERMSRPPSPELSLTGSCLTSEVVSGLTSTRPAPCVDTWWRSHGIRAATSPPLARG